MDIGDTIENGLLLSVTEMHTRAEIEALAKAALKDIAAEDAPHDD